MNTLAATTPASIADTWQQHTLRANTEYQLACYDDAIRLHGRALDYARNDFAERARYCIDHAIARVLISHFSLAECHGALADHSRAAGCYLAAQKFLLQCQRDLPAGVRAQRAIAHAHQHLHELWSQLTREHEDAIPGRFVHEYEASNALLTQETPAASVLH